MHQYRPAYSAFLGSPAVEAVLTFDDGLVVNYSGSWAGRGFNTPYDGEYLVEGERGTIQISNGRVLLDLFGGDNRPVVEYVISEEEQADTVSDLSAVLAEFCTALASGRRPSTDLRDNSKSIAMLFAARRSVESGRQAPVDRS